MLVNITAISRLLVLNMFNKYKAKTIVCSQNYILPVTIIDSSLNMHTHYTYKYNCKKLYCYKGEVGYNKVLETIKH